MDLGEVTSWLDWQLLAIILPFIMVILVIAIGEIMFRDRRMRLRPERLQKQLEVQIPKAKPSAEEAPIPQASAEESDEDHLKRLQAEVDRVLLLYTSGQLSKGEFYAAVHRVEGELQGVRARAPPAEPTGTRRCIHCLEEIPVEAVYCDRCGRYIGTSHP
ncbi:zinc ribbon domain-containing protein [Candidatus Bathyarchaeota archaeon]|nr:zinc ribbon domain-containing protein [Candidatus Bathyarchaeota archaeon]